MKNTIQIFAIFFSLITVFSCDSKRDLNGDLLFGLNPVEGDGNGGNPTNSKLLKKTITTDDEGEVLIYNYAYDAQKRLTGVTTSDNSKTVTVTYTADGKIDKITIKDDLGGGTFSTDILIPAYTNNQITSLETTTTENGNSLKRRSIYTYNSNGWPTNVKENVLNPDDNTTVVASLISNFTYSGNNISKWNIKQTLDFTFPIPVFDFLKEMEITMDFSDYDNKINPYNLLPKDYLIATVHTDINDSSVMGYAKNNAKKIKASFSIGGSQPVEDTQTAVYVYDNDGYPLSGISSSGGSVKFEYQ